MADEIKRIGFNITKDNLQVGFHGEGFQIDLSKPDNATLKSQVETVFATIEAGMSQETKDAINEKINTKKTTATAQKDAAQAQINELDAQLIT